MDRARDANISIATSTIRRGDPARIIVEHAKAERHDLIVVGTHGRAGLAHLFLGSVAERVVRTAPVPVLTVPCPTPKPGHH
jgi:nucleotide-binding universal stress UspA family protein